jgi:DNA-binding transcriptional LysR family regulator
VFKDGYGMQRLVQEVCLKQGIPLRIALELNTPETFRGVVRQGEMIALLPAGALVEARSDSTLAVRQVATLPGEERWTREVAMVTTSDRLQIPPIAYFCQYVRELMVPASLPPKVAINNRTTVALGSS